MNTGPLGRLRTAGSTLRSVAPRPTLALPCGTPVRARTDARLSEADTCRAHRPRTPEHWWCSSTCLRRRPHNHGWMWVSPVHFGTHPGRRLRAASKSSGQGLAGTCSPRRPCTQGHWCCPSTCPLDIAHTLGRWWQSQPGLVADPHCISYAFGTSLTHRGLGRCRPGMSCTGHPQSR